MTVHLHPYGDDGRETLDAEPCAAALRAVRSRCPGVPISLSTSAEIEPDVSGDGRLWRRGPTFPTS